MPHWFLLMTLFSAFFCFLGVSKKVYLCSERLFLEVSRPKRSLGCSSTGRRDSFTAVNFSVFPPLLANSSVQVGTYQISIVAKALGKPVYVAAESFKMIRLFPLRQRDVRGSSNPLFGPVSPSRLPDSEQKGRSGTNITSWRCHTRAIAESRSGEP